MINCVRAFTHLMGAAVSFLWFRPLEWQCKSSLQRQQLESHRRIDGSGEWGSAPNIRVNDKISLRTLPLTFTFTIGVEGTDRFFGRLQYISPGGPVTRAEIHIVFSLLVQDFDDLWIRSSDRIPQRIHFEVEGLPDDPNTFLIANYGFENIAPVNGDRSNTIKNQRGDEFSPRLSKLEDKINVLGEFAIGIFASVVTSSFWLFSYIASLKGYAMAAALVLVLAFFLRRLTPSLARSESVADGTKRSATTPFFQIPTMVGFCLPEGQSSLRSWKLGSRPILMSILPVSMRTRGA